jgi:hypothetical protein
MFKKNAFKGKGRSLADPVPARPPPPAAPPPAAPPSAGHATRQVSAPVEPPPGPDNRSTKVSVKQPSGSVTPNTDSDPSFYKLTGEDVKGLLVGERAKQEKTFADVRRPPKVQPLTANVKFQVLIEKNTINVEAKFQTSESLAALYTYLETEVFESVNSFEIRFMAKPIPRDARVTLASEKLCGPIMLTVVVSGKAKLKVH